MNYLTALGRRLKAPSCRAGFLNGFAFFTCALVLVLPTHSLAQFTGSSIVETYLVSGETPRTGDIIAFDTTEETYRLADESTAVNLFGVVVSEPTIVLRTFVGGVPIVTEGEVAVNVTTANGPILVGDYIAASKEPGKGQKAAADASFVLGMALEPFSGVASTTAGGGSSTPYTGTIRVFLAVGPHEQPAATSTATGSAIAVEEEVASVSTPISRLIKYMLASLIVFGTIYLAFKNFTANLKDSVVSVGRNPLAKASIQSMVVLNTSLTVVVSAIGLFIGLMVLFLPL